MRRALLIFVFISLITANVRGQYWTNQNMVWAFGTNAGVNFNTGSPVPFSSSINTYAGCASVCNSAGSLLFYTDGKNVWNNTGSLMPLGSSIVSFSTNMAAQSAVIVPVPGNANQYYIFSIEQTGGSTGYCHLAYSIVDMTLASGLGNLVSGSIGVPITSGLSEKMIAIAGNSCNIWLLVHSGSGSSSSQFYAYNINAAGISSTPVTSTVGTLPGNSSGVIKASPNRLKIVAQFQPEFTAQGTELYDFDPGSGVVSNCQVLSTSLTTNYGAEFSPDNTKLYTQTYSGAHISQYDITLSTTAAIIASETIIAYVYGADLRLAPDGKIYTTDEGYGWLNCITAPNAAGTSCGFTTHAVTLSSGTLGRLGLPNLFVSVAPNDTSYTVHDTSLCIPIGGSVTIAAPDTGTGLGYLWNDGLTTTGTHSISAYGTYWVGIYNGCNITIDTIHVMPLSADSISGLTSLCAGSTLTLSPSVTSGTWSSSTTSTATVGSGTGVITGVAAGTTTVTYSHSSYCPIAVVVTINPIPTAISGVSFTCEGSTISLTDATSGGTWSSSSTAVATIDMGGTVAGGTVGTSIINYTLLTGCTIPISVTVNPLPAPILGSVPLCPGETTILTDMTSGGTWTSSSPSIASVGSATGMVTGSTVLLTTIVSAIYTGPNGCSAMSIITINPLPSAITGTPDACIGTTTPLSEAGIGTWASSNTAIASVNISGIAYGELPGTTIITFTSIAGCFVTLPFTVYPLPGPISSPGSICDGLDITLMDTTAAGTWASGNMTVASIDPLMGVVTSIFPGTTTITYTSASTGCTTSGVLTVNPSPGTMTYNPNVCLGGGSALSVATTTSATSGGVWSSSNTSVATVAAIGAWTGRLSGVSPGITVISYTISDGCFVSDSVTVFATPPITGASTLCVGLATLLTDAVSGGAWSSSNSDASITASSGILTGVSPGATVISYLLGSGCIVSTTVTVSSSPSAVTGNMRVCIGDTTGLADPAVGGSWTSTNTSIATIGSTGTVRGVTAGTAAIIYSIGAGCSTSIVVTVSTLPPAITGTASVCAGATTMLIDPAGSGTSSAGTWSSSGTAIATIGSTGTVEGISAGTTNLTFTATSTGCSVHTVVTVNGLPSLITGTLSLCSGATALLIDLTTGGTWASSPASSGIATITSTGSVSGFAPGTSVITYTAHITGCTRTAVVTVDPLPAMPSSASLSVCAGAAITVTDATSGGTWSASPTSIATITAAGLINGEIPGIVMVSYTIPTGCAQAVIVTVNPLPMITGPTAECVGATISESVPISGTWTPTTGGIATVNSTGIVTGVATGTTTITYISAAGCKAETTITVSLSPSAITGVSSICAGDTATLGDAVGGGVWSSGNTLVATMGSLSPTVTGVSPGTSTITYSLGTGCTVSRTISVNAAPAAITGTTSLCAGAITALADGTTGGTWSGGLSAIATITGTGDVTGISPGTATISYAHGGCAATAIVTVNLAPTTITGTMLVCAGATTSLSDGVTGGAWSSSNTAIANFDASGNITGGAPGTATISYSLGAGCTVNTVVTVHPIAPITGSAGLCVGTTTLLADAVTGGIWSRGTTAVATVSMSGSVLGEAPGTSTITYTTAAGCSATTIVTVNLAPSVIGGTLHVCAGATTTLSNTAGGGTWTSPPSGIATVSSSGAVTGIIPGTITISYSLGSGCSVSATVTVNGAPAAIIGASICAGSSALLGETTTGGVWSSSATGTATVTATGGATGISAGTTIFSYTLADGCAATATVTVDPLPGSIIGALHVCVGLTTDLTGTAGGTWSSSNTAIAGVDVISGTVTGEASGTAVITYMLSTGCATSVAVSVNAAPSAISGITTMCLHATVSLSDAPGGGTWSSSDIGIATVSSGGIVSGNSLGTSTISYMVGGCPAMATVSVNAPPDAFAPPRLCAGTAEILTDMPDGGTWSSSPSGSGIATIDETSGTLYGVAPGTSMITYSMGVGCTAAATVIVEALPAAITGTSEVCLGYNTLLDDPSGGGVWSSSNTAIGTITNAGRVFGVSGGPTTISYTSSLTGCTAIRLVTVVAVPPILGVADMCAFTSTIAVSDALTGGTWTSTSATVSTAGIITPYSAGPASVTYTIPLGCYVAESFTVHPLPGPVEGIPRFCRGSSETFSDTSAGGTWSSSNALIAPINLSGLVRGASAGIATISYTLPTGCMETQAVTIDSMPVAGTITGSTNVCPGAIIVLSDPAAVGAWSASNTLVTLSGDIVTGVSAGVDTVRYTVSNSCGSAQTTKVVTVSALPEAGTIIGPVSVCTGDSIFLTDAATGGVWSSGAAGTVTAGSVAGASVGTDTIMYTVTNICGVAIAQKVVTVNAPPDPGTIRGGVDSMCNGSSLMLTDAVTGGAWSSGNSAIINMAGPGLIVAESVGMDTIAYSIVNVCGTASANVVIAVKPGTVAGTIGGSSDSVCVGSTVTLTGTPQGGTWASSNSTVTITPAATGVIISGIAAGADTILYVITGECGQAVADYPITVLSSSGCDTKTPVAQHGAETLLVWPNPNDGTFTVLLSSGTNEGIQITITNIIGEKVNELTTVADRETALLLKDAPGVYFINVSTSVGIYIAKMVLTK